jgi:hypothetical protein
MTTCPMPLPRPRRAAQRLRGLAEGADEGAAHPSLDMPVYEPDEEHATAQGLKNP